MNILLVVPLLPTCMGLVGSDISFVRSFVKDWKGYDSVNIFSCPGYIKASDLYLLNDDMILFRYVDITKQVNTEEMDRDSNCRQVYVIDIKCGGALNLIREMSNRKFFVSFCRSILVINTYNREAPETKEIEDVFRDIELTVTSDFVYAVKHPLNGSLYDENPIFNFFLYDVW